MRGHPGEQVVKPSNRAVPVTHGEREGIWFQPEGCSLVPRNAVDPMARKASWWN